MLKQSVILEIVKDDRIYRLSLPDGCPLGEIHDVLFQMRSFVVDKINASVEAERPKTPIAQVEDQPKVE